jgi:hypothetical protein
MRVFNTDNFDLAKGRQWNGFLMGVAAKAKVETACVQVDDDTVRIFGGDAINGGKDLYVNSFDLFNNNVDVIVNFEQVAVFLGVVKASA